MEELVRIAFTKVSMEALQGNTPKGVFFRVVFIPIFKAPFKYVSIEPVITKKDHKNLLLRAVVHLRECHGPACG